MGIETRFLHSSGNVAAYILLVLLITTLNKFEEGNNREDMAYKIEKLVPVVNHLLDVRGSRKRSEKKQNKGTDKKGSSRAKTILLVGKRPRTSSLQYDFVVLCNYMYELQLFAFGRHCVVIIFLPFLIFPPTWEELFRGSDHL